MKKRLRAGLAIAATALVAATFLPEALAQGDPAPKVDVLREQSVAEAPQVTLPRGVVEAASAYETYLRHAAAIQAAFRNGEAVSRAMNVGEAYQPHQIQEGLIAYAALIALEDRRFVRGVQGAITSRAEADHEAAVLLADPSQVAAIRGANDASALIGATLRDQGGQLFSTGRAVKQSAYDVQRQAWSKRTVPDQMSRLAQAKSMAQFPYIPAPDDVSHLLQIAASYRGRQSGDPEGAKLTPAIQRGLTLAALALLGEAGDEARLTPILSEGGGADCMKMAKLNLYQCLAVAGPHYEDIFCLGQHALMDTGQCVAGMAGGDAEQNAPRPEALSVPIAQNSYRR
jgi:hypothetical protein